MTSVRPCIVYYFAIWLLIFAKTVAFALNLTDFA